MHATFASETRFLVAAKWACRVKTIEGICPDNAGSNFVGHCENAASLLGPDSGTESVGSVIRFLNCFIGGPESENTEYWSKNFLAGNTVGLRDVGKHCGSEPETFLWNHAIRTPTLGAFIFTTLGQVNNSIELLT